MKKLLYLLLLSGGLLSATFASADMVVGGVWYDQQEMAVAIDLGHDGWDTFNQLELDFNAEREWGQIIDGSEIINTGAESVRRYQFGVFKSIRYPDGRTARYFGWGNAPLYDNESRSEWIVAVDKLYYGEKSPESLFCYTLEWTPKDKKKTIYCQSLDTDGNNIAVLPTDVDKIFVRHPNAEWTPLSQIRKPAPPLQVAMQVLPNVLNRSSRGKYLTVKISLPQDIDPEDLDLAMSLQFTVANQTDGTPEEVHVQPVKWNGTFKEGKPGQQQLIFKVAREELTRVLSPGEASIILSGQTNSNQGVSAKADILIQ